MKKKILLAFALACVLTLCACGGAVSSVGQPETASVPAQPSSVPGEAASGEAAPLELNKALFKLLQGDNAALKQIRQGNCYAEIPGRGTAQVLYFDPFLDVQMIPPEEGTFAAWREGYSEGHQTENPFVDELPVLELTVEDEIDPLAPAVSGQDSLRQLFVTDALITYQLLCDDLDQTPELTHTGDVYYSAPIPENWPLGSDPGQPITGGDWCADFSANGLRLTVRFIRADGEYVAYRATLSEE